jgi:hypothetical protein
MNLKKIALGLGISAAVLALCISAFATTHIALLPGSATLSMAGPTTSVDLDAFCNFTPCNIQWIVILSNANVGSITNTTGPTTTFNVGTEVGTAHVIATDGAGHTAQATVTVQQ